jgi:serine/threonine protein kinase/Tol biopolymer transport system component
MTITAGTRIGAYEVTSQLGEGGMGVVFRARDTKLLRDVAVKVLPDHFADDTDRLSRLQREAQLLASLNHPNIAQIYGLEQLGTSGCIVMELVEGETLGDRLKNGPVPLDEAIEVAKQIADALAAAHERGIIHRDLKPANIKLTPNGTVKVLDFGLAKAIVTRSQSTELSAMPTIVSGSVAGMVVGTAAYMSPEQARGKDVDARTDIWAFGCVLFEMLTGKQAFEGETFTDIAARIVSGQPDMDLLPASVPRSVRLLLDSTLNKNQSQRLQHIADMRLFLDQKLFPPVGTGAVATHENTSDRGKFWIAAFAILLIAALVPTALYFRRPSQHEVPMRFEIALPVIAGGQFSVSPNGARLAYVAQPPNENRAIWIRPIGSETAQKLTGTENASGGVAWSPDSRYVAFVVDDKLKKIDVVSGAIQTICDIKGRLVGFTWNQDGVMLLGNLLGNDSRIVRVSDAGGEVKTQVALDPARKDQQVALPVFLPDGNHFLYVAVNSVQDNSGFYVGSLDSKAPKRLMPLGSRVAGMAYSPQGYIIIAGETLTAHQFDLSRLEIQGQPVQLAEMVDSFSVSDTGLLLFRKGVVVQQNKELTWYNRSGEAMGRVGAPANYGDVELSPKADRVAVDMVSNQNRDVWAIDIPRNVTSRITSDAASDWSPSWSPDESQLIFASSRGGVNHIYRKSSTGVGEEEMVSPNDSDQIPVNWSPDGRYIVFSRLRPAGSTIGGVDTWVMENFGDKKARPFVKSQFDKAQARISPDGHFLAYATNDSGIYQIVVQTFPDPNGAKWQITAQGGVEPKWRRDGRELYYLGLDGKLMGVPVKQDHTFGTPVVLFQTPLAVVRNQTPRDRRYDVASDGRFLIAVPVASNTEPTIFAAINWAARLGEKK